MHPHTALLALGLILGGSPGSAQEPKPAKAVPRPPEVTDSAIARGRELYHGSANCAACHGVEGIGTDSGPALAQGVWMHGPDTYEGILERVTHGIPEAWSTRGVAMPIRGWQTLDDASARDVTAYVWHIGHAWKPSGKKPPGS
ncbi:MAG: cytochrome c [Gemmatimonadota bacterium]|nr:cytochrome c [Gemmatimonadota bacterium]MDH4347229.1 cytochrome c [Gemmatimonadota bacterium]MDH5284462.1 cytochrome c [Gemmatimonadota bacterium]